MKERPCIVAIGAHAADMEFTAGATLLKHARSGWDAHIVHLTLGEKGNYRLSPEEYGAQKRREAEAAAAVLQVTPHFLPYRDGELTVSDDIACELAKVLRQLQPQVVITHWHGSIHSDHIATHHLTRRAVFMAANPHFDLDGLPPARGMRLYYAENWEDAENFRPFVYVDISDVFAEWERAFKCFAIGRGEGGFPYWDWYHARTRLRGIEIGVLHAQTFAVDEWRMRQKRDTL
ncbi:N-acetyl-alpha-D-glucosaminyl L-malate deacetylase 1 [bacterium HR17]|jgi:LmbE family N-acetylglucosaminyl deacetylase|uniref:N-acetyl-alpha-D-glucosaminyl L-malate deacetylase 1 n=1 Tax=Candidatus Fervidibacter japonicus TaxID=2035412 RepID=A0A2H5XDY9_9BACT|nr:N-acetyl-alpha-D-glucosaminyl L-malate deacetylase 1 [bacterium HR17]